MGVAGRAGERPFEIGEQVEYTDGFEYPIALFADVTLREHPCFGETVDGRSGVHL